MSDNEYDSDSGMGLGDLMGRSPSPEPAPNTFSTYAVPNGLLKDKEELVIRLVGSHPLWGHHLWNTARVTTTYLLTNPSLTRTTRVLELGAGGALPSIACALAGAQVVATDYADASLMENISFNASANGATLHAVGHTWGKAVDDLLSAGTGGRYDVVILSDLMFNHSQHDALIATLDKTLKLGPGQPSMPEEERGTTSTTPDLPAHVAQNPLPPTPCALVFLTHHRPRLADEDMAFLPRLAKHGWGYERVTHEYTGPMFENDPGDERVRGTVHGFRCWRL